MYRHVLFQITLIHTYDATLQALSGDVVHIHGRRLLVTVVGDVLVAVMCVEHVGLQDHFAVEATLAHKAFVTIVLCGTLRCVSKGICDALLGIPCNWCTKISKGKLLFSDLI